MNWFAARTRSRHEFKVGRQLAAIGIEHYLPTWKKGTVEHPLFTGYVFTRCGVGDFIRVLSTVGVCDWVRFAKTPATIPDEEIETLRTVSILAPKPSTWQTGQKVRIVGGPLAGQLGVVERAGSNRVVLRPVSLMNAVAVTVSPENLEHA